MRSLHFRLIAACLLGASLMFATAAHADSFKAMGFVNGSQTVTLVSPGFTTRDVSAGAFSLATPAGDISYCIDIFEGISFGTTYNNVIKTPLAADSFILPISATRKGEIAQLYHSFYFDSLTSSTKSAAFQLALWEILYETSSTLNVDGNDATHKGFTDANSPDTPAGVISQADTWLAGLGGSTDTTGLFTYRRGDFQDQLVYHPTPEPPAWVLLGAGLGVVAFLVRRRAIS